VTELARELEAMDATIVVCNAYYNSRRRKACISTTVRLRSNAAADCSLQRAWPLRNESGAGDGCATCANRKYCWPERGVRKYWADGGGLNAVPDDFSVLAGDDSVALPLFALGGKGVISVAANEVPREMAQLCDADWRAILQARGDSQKAFAADGDQFCGVEPDSSESGDEFDGIAGAGVAVAVGAPKAENLQRFAPCWNRWKSRKGERCVASTAN